MARGLAREKNGLAGPWRELRTVIPILLGGDARAFAGPSSVSGGHTLPSAVALVLSSSVAGPHRAARRADALLFTLSIWE